MRMGESIAVQSHCPVLGFALEAKTVAKVKFSCERDNRPSCEERGPLSYSRLSSLFTAFLLSHHL